MFVCLVGCWLVSYWYINRSVNVDVNETTAAAAAAASIVILDVLLDKLKRGKENGIHQTRAAHGDCQAAIHVALEKGDFRGCFDFLAAGVEEGVALVDAFCRVDRVYFG